MSCQQRVLHSTRTTFPRAIPSRFLESPQTLLSVPIQLEQELSHVFPLDVHRTVQRAHHAETSNLIFGVPVIAPRVLLVYSTFRPRIPRVHVHSTKSIFFISQKNLGSALYLSRRAQGGRSAFCTQRAPHSHQREPIRFLAFPRTLRRYRVPLIPIHLKKTVSHNARHAVQRVHSPGTSNLIFVVPVNAMRRCMCMGT